MIKTPYQDKNSIRYKIRKRRVKYLVSLVEKIISQHNLTEIKIADIGGNKIYWKIFPFEQFPDIQFKIDLINLQEFKLYMEEDANNKNVQFTPLVGDCTQLSMPDKSYHLCHSNSVIEHVGSWVNVQKTVSESKRIASYIYHQTPNFWFPYEPHYRKLFIHWLPTPTVTNILIKRQYKTYDSAKNRQDEIALLTYRDMKLLFPTEYIVKERYLFVKSFLALSKL